MKKQICAEPLVVHLKRNLWKKRWLADWKWLQNCKAVGDLILQSPHHCGDGFGTMVYESVWNTLPVIPSGLNGSYTNDSEQDRDFMACRHC